MYKKSLRSLPRSIKNEIVKQLELFDSVDDIIPISESDLFSHEKFFVKRASKIRRLPSFWLISSRTQKDIVFIVFEGVLSEVLEEKLHSLDVNFDFCFSYESLSSYYGIY